VTIRRIRMKSKILADYYSRLVNVLEKIGFTYPVGTSRLILLVLVYCLTIVIGS
jgi:hypothetical protein